jgi:hypothetical protein
MNDLPNTPNFATEGESLSPHWSFKWINPSRIEAGEAIAPARLSTPRAHEFAALNLVSEDLAFAHDCFTAAAQLGIPDSTNLQITSLIFSGVVGYARCFKSGVRKARLDSSTLKASNVTVDLEVHEYLISLRDKHVAHSVNDFEECEAVAIVVGRPEVGWRDGSGVGVIMKRSVGISASLLKRAIAHIAVVQKIVSNIVEGLRIEVYTEFKESFDKDQKWECAPLVHFSDRSAVAKPRK